MNKKTVIDLSLKLSGVLLIFTLATGISIYYGVSMPGESFKGEMPAIDTELQFSRDRLSTHVHALAEEIGERHHQQRDKLDEAADYVEKSFRDMGYNPAS
ncbi:MAG: hypothetical protein ACI9SC_002715, partial [Gammaproteobacteria bacterium]